jgi:UDP-glucose 4-epimerase
MQMRNVLITGGLGLIGSGLRTILNKIGIDVGVFDRSGSRVDGTFGDVLDLEGLRSRIDGFDGVIHLAAVSRVVWGERNPKACWATNVDGTRNVLTAASELTRHRRPWVVYASSREVYGQGERLPISEDDTLRPVNIYGRSKMAAEELTIAARSSGLTTAVARFSNVYGSTNDHRDRVVPAFARAAATGGVIRVEGAQNVFDFTWLDDLCGGVLSLCRMMSGETKGPPTIHFVTGVGTSLLELAQMAMEAGKPNTRLEHRPPRDFDVASFRGDPRRAQELLGWRAETSVKAGVRRLVAAFATELDQRETEPAA